MPKKKQEKDVRITDKELANITTRISLLEQRKFEVQVLDHELNHYINLLLTEYKKDKDKDKYVINVETGMIIEKPKK